jgi:SH3 domain-containing YSC84-like protein 1
VKSGRKIMTRATLRTICAALLLAVVAISLSSAAFAQADQRTLVSTATLTLSGFLNDPDMPWLRNNFNRAKAVLIAPHITRAGFIIGGSGGRALVLARNPKTGNWAGPAFYVLVTGSVGFQAGVSVSETVSLVMTEKGLDSLLSSSFKMGGDVSVAAGPIGTGAKSDLVADFISFSRSKGIYGGLNLDGTIASTADEWNRLYYGRSVNVPDILLRESVHNKQANELINVVAAAARKK